MDDIRSQVTQIHRDLSEVKSTLALACQKMDLDIANRNEYREDREERDRKIDHVLFGNGKPGLVEDVRSMKQTQSGFLKAAWAAATAGISALATSLWGLLNNS